MSLDADYTHIADWEEKCYVPSGTDAEGKQLYEVHPVTQALVFMSMDVGMPEITEKEWKEFWIRSWIVEKCFGTMLQTAGRDRPLTPDDVVAHIGLRTNCAPKSKVQFKTHVVNGMRVGAGRRLSKWGDEKKKASEKLGEAVNGRP